MAASEGLEEMTWIFEDHCAQLCQRRWHTEEAQANQQAMAIVEVRGEGDLDQSGDREGGEKGLDPEICILKVEELEG